LISNVSNGDVIAAVAALVNLAEKDMSLGIPRDRSGSRRNSLGNISESVNETRNLTIPRNRLPIPPVDEFEYILELHPNGQNQLVEDDRFSILGGLEPGTCFGMVRADSNRSFFKTSQPNISDDYDNSEACEHTEDLNHELQSGDQGRTDKNLKISTNDNDTASIYEGIEQCGSKKDGIDDQLEPLETLTIPTITSGISAKISVER
jgi:hypothetical protein